MPSFIQVDLGLCWEWRMNISLDVADLCGSWMRGKGLLLRLHLTPLIWKCLFADKDWIVKDLSPDFHVA